MSLALAGLCASACGSEPVVRWSVQFACDQPSEDIQAVETRILLGGCDGTEIYRARVERADMGAEPERPGMLGEGHYGFEAVAIGSDARAIATFCRETELPSTETLELILGAGACGDAPPGDEGDAGTSEPECPTPAACGLCEDNPSFVDATGLSCEGWLGYDCLSAEQMWDYTLEEGRAVRDNCPRACALCAPD